MLILESPSVRAALLRYAELKFNSRGGGQEEGVLEPKSPLVEGAELRVSKRQGSIAQVC